MKLKNIIRWITSTVGMASTFLISASVSNFHTYEIQYENTDNIDVNNLTRKYNSNVETKLVKTKAKNEFIFSGWKLKDETIIDTIAVGTQENIILSPVLINEYPNYSFIKNLFIDSSSKTNFDIRLIKIKQLITKEELAFGNEKYQLQKLIVELIINFNNKLIQDTILDSQFASGSHVSNNYTSIQSQFNVEKIEKTKEEILKNPNKKVSVWGLLWEEVKGWWNNWMGTAFYGLIGVSATIGIGYSAYTSYWNNKRNFILNDGEKLKIKLELYPDDRKNIGHWFARFYNKGSAIKTTCICQTRFEKRNNTLPLSIEYILTNTPKNPGLLLYNTEKNDKKGKDNFDTNFISIKDYYPGTNEIIVFGFENGGKEKKRLGRLKISRELIRKEQSEKCYTLETKEGCNNQSSSHTTTNGKTVFSIAEEQKEIPLTKIVPATLIATNNSN
ncbi:hypothetical protein QLQ80_02355 [Mycoplasma sp. M5725]|uniref:Uncharacterized protein n=1 Tax=Mycoplasma phocimorsus TaxID=3045839 RepID=A0AAJ1UWX3_9MOLU|nr:hypothetical protein [Mycoplasma phocimorsus]MDJ1645915.1 hypothetical protein [Mycoplasma phocimorsus]